MAQCEGKKRSTGDRCKAPAITGRRFCRVHGGLLPRGKDNNFYVHGRYSSVVPERMQDDILRLLGDVDLLELNDELALLKARVRDVITRVELGESGKTWKALRAQMRAHDKAMRAGDVDQQAEALYEIRKLVLDGSRDWDAWEDVRSVVRDVTKVAESQRRRVLEQHHMITVDAAYAMLDSLVDAVRRSVTDEHTRDLVAAEFSRIVHKPGPAAAHPEGGTFAA
jgi:hypothetical protein